MPSETPESQGIITHRSPWPLGQTLERLESAIAAKGLKVFAHLDQQAEARAVGLDQPPVHLFLVGNPRGGTPVMVAAPQAGLDLPLKVLVWEATPGVVHVSLNSTDYLAARYGLAPELVQGLRGLESLVKASLTDKWFIRGKRTSGLKKRGHAGSFWSCETRTRREPQHVHQPVVPCLRPPRL